MTINIAFLYHPQLNIGGVETHIKSIAKGAKAEGFRLFLFAPVSEAYKDAVKSLGVEYIVWVPRSVWSLDSFYRLIQLLKLHRISLLHIHSPEVLVIGKLAAWFCQIPVVVTVHLFFNDYFKGKSISARIKKWLYFAVDSTLNLFLNPYVIYVSSRFEEGDENSLRLRPRTFVIHNGVDLERFGNGRRNRLQNRTLFGVKLDTIVITFVGRLDQQKGVDLLLEAFLEFKKTFQDTMLWLIGDGPLRKEIEGRATQITAGAIVFWGFREDVPELLSASDIFVLPSRYESTPIALLEAMAAGVPSIATQVGELIIDNKRNGILVPAENVAELTKAMGHLATNSKVRRQFESAGRKRAEDFPIQRMVEKTYLVYKEALGNSRMRH